MPQGSKRAQPQVGIRGSVVRDPEQRESQRQQILLAAAKVFARKGYESATMEDIAREMSVSKGILYYQFRSKQDLIVATRVEASGTALQRLEKIAGEPGDPVARLEAALRDLVSDNFRELSRHVILIPSVVGVEEQGAEQIRAIERRYEQLLASLFEAGVKSGDFVPADPQLTVYTLIRAAESPSFWYRPGGRISRDAIIEGVTGMLMRGISLRS